MQCHHRPASCYTNTCITHPPLFSHKTTSCPCRPSSHLLPPVPKNLSSWYPEPTGMGSVDSPSSSPLTSQLTSSSRLRDIQCKLRLNRRLALRLLDSVAVIEGFIFVPVDLEPPEASAVRSTHRSSGIWTLTRNRDDKVPSARHHAMPHHASTDECSYVRGSLYQQATIPTLKSS